MATTIKTDIIIPDVFAEAVQGQLAQKTAFMGSPLASLGVVVISDGMPAGPNELNDLIKVPYFGTIGEFQANSTDGNSVTPTKLAMTSEQTQVGRDSLAFEATAWSQGAGKTMDGGDPYVEGARQVEGSATRAMDAAIITAALATGVYAASYYSSTSPQYLSYDMAVDAKGKYWNDEQEDIAAMLIHSRTHVDLLKLKDASGRPMLVTPDGPNAVTRFLGLPIIISDRVPLTGSSMGAVTSAGTTPPVITLSGTPTGAWDLKIKVIVGGALATWTLQFSTDGGNTYSATITSAASVPLVDTATDSLVGNNGATGITASIASGTANVDNMWVAKANLKARTLLLKKRALAFWFNRSLLKLLTDKDILKHSDVCAMHLYRAAHRYRRLPGSTKGGVLAIDHNVTNFVG